MLDEAQCWDAVVAVGGLLAGWALDRFDRRRVMIADSLVRGVAFAAIPLSVASGHLSSTLLYAVAAVYGLFKMVGLAGFPSLIPALVPHDRLDQANALEGVSYGLASLAGATLAGLAVATVGPAWVVSFDAASYGVLALSLWSARGLSRRCAGEHRQARRRQGSVRAVMRLAVTNSVLRDTTIMFALFNVGEGALLVFLPHRAPQLGLGAGGYGYLVAATTGGELLAATVLVRRQWNLPLALSITAAQAAAATVLLIAPAALVTIVALIMLGGCAAPMTARAQSLRMRLVDAELHGRLFAVLRTRMQATPPLGALLASLTLRHGTVTTVLAAAAMMGVPAAVLGPYLIRRATRSTTDSEPEVPAPPRSCVPGK